MTDNIELSVTFIYLKISYHHATKSIYPLSSKTLLTIPHKTANFFNMVKITRFLVKLVKNTYKILLKSKKRDWKNPISRINDSKYYNKICYK